MLVSVIIPTYNHEEFLVQRLETVLSQTYQDMEVIILDDCSPDNSREILERYRSHPRINHIVYNKVNSGSTFKQWNKGVRLAKGEWIWIAESDDKADADFLASLMHEIQENNTTGIAYCQSYRLNDKDEVTGSWLEWTDDLDKSLFMRNFKMDGIDFIQRFLLHKNTIPNASAVLFNKQCYQKVGGADEAIRNCSDWELWLKMLLISDITYIAKPLNYFRFHERSVIAKAINSRNSKLYGERFDRTMRLFFQKHIIENFSNDPKYYNILERNKDYIIEENVYEALFEAIHVNFSAGWRKAARIFSQEGFLTTTRMFSKVILKESVLKS